MSSVAKTISKNAISLIVGSFASQALRIVYVSILARYIGTEGFGQISTATALTSVLILLVNFGFDMLIVRDVAADQQRAAKYVTNVIFVRFALTLVLALVLAVILSLSPYPYQTKVIIVIYAGIYVVDTLTAVVRCIFNAYQKMEYSSLIDFGRHALNFLLTVIGIWLGWSLAALVMMSLAASLTKLVVSVVVMRRRFVRPVFDIDLRLSRSLMRDAFPYFLGMLVGMVAENINVLALSWFDTADAVGIFSAALVPIVALLTLPEMFAESVFPVFSQYHKISPEKLGVLYKISYKLMVLLGFPLGMGAILISKDLMRIFYGADFDQSFIVMNLISIRLFTIVGYVNGNFMAATGRQPLFVGLRLLSAAMNALLCLVLIPRYSYNGAAMAFMIPTIFDFILFTILGHYFAKVPFEWVGFFGIALSTAIMGTLGYLALANGIPVILVVFLSPLVYVGMIIVTQVIGPQEWEFITEIAFLKNLRQRLSKRFHKRFYRV